MFALHPYVLHPEIRNKLKLDPEAAEVVRRVFDEALEGRNTSQIALSLNDDNIPTPGQYFKSKHPDKKKFSRMSDKICSHRVQETPGNQKQADNRRGNPLDSGEDF